jgi:hypothetical protein
VLVFPKPASDPGKLGIPICSFQLLALERLQKRVGEMYEGWGREAAGGEPGTAAGAFFVDVAGRRYRGETLLHAVIAAKGSRP